MTAMPAIARIAAASCLLAVSACSVTLVQPYDEKLRHDTEEVFRKASAIIDAGIVASPATDEERAALTDAHLHPGHLDRFSEGYASLNVDADVLILHALSGSRTVSPVGVELQTEIEALIERAIPSACDDLQAELGARSSSLTVRNYVDLKCLFVRWRVQHADPALTQGTQVLKKSNWELRRSAVFNAVLAIQSAESSKTH